MKSLLQDLRYAGRLLLRSPGFTLLAALTLALGIGANAAIFSVANAVLLKPLPYRDSGRLTIVYSQFPAMGFDHFWVDPVEFTEYRRAEPELRRPGRLSHVLRERRGPRTSRVRAQAALASAGLFRALGVDARAGALLHRGRGPAQRREGGGARRRPLAPGLRGRPRHPRPPHQGGRHRPHRDRRHAARLHRRRQADRGLGAAGARPAQAGQPGQSLPLPGGPAEARRLPRPGALRDARPPRPLAARRRSRCTRPIPRTTPSSSSRLLDDLVGACGRRSGC